MWIIGFTGYLDVQNVITGFCTMAPLWGRIADYSQRGISILLFGLTVVGTLLLAQGGYGVVQRRKQRKALPPGTSGGDNSQQVRTILMAR